MSVGGRSGAEPAPVGWGVATPFGHGDLGEPAVHGSAGVGSAARGGWRRQRLGADAGVGRVNRDGAPRSGQRGAVPRRAASAGCPAHPGRRRTPVPLVGADPVRAVRPATRLAPVHGRAGYRCRHGRSSSSPPRLDEPKTVYVREDRLVQELRDWLPRRHAGAEHDDVGSRVATLRREGALITHDGTTWGVTST